MQDDIVGVIDASGNIVASYTYDTWGALISSSGSLAEINPLRYRGYYYDSETGMYYLQSRYYDPSLKRFINADDAELIADLALESVLGGNIFAYCENNAINRIDPDGYDAIFDKYLKKEYKGKAVIAILVKQPVKNSRVVAGSDVTNVGHSFIAIYDGKNTVNYKGFYPSKPISASQVVFKSNVPSHISDDSLTAWTVAKIFTIDKKTYNRIIEKYKSYKNKYNVVSNNCTTVAVNMLNAASVNHQIKKHYWTFPYYLKQLVLYTCALTVLSKKTNLQTKVATIAIAKYINSYYGYTPADAAEDIRYSGNYVAYNSGTKLTIYYRAGRSSRVFTSK